MDELQERMAQIPARHATVGLALAVVRTGEPVSFYSHGYADIPSAAPVTPDTVFRVGSITKTFTAIAVMQLWEQGLIDLDAPAEAYLRAYRLAPALIGQEPPTVRHLLTHTAGLPELVYPARAFVPVLGETQRSARPLPSLDRFYRGRLRLVTEPGTTFTYSNHGFATLGQMVADVTGEPLRSYLRRNVFEPLGMQDTNLIQVDRVRPGRATGYTMRGRGPQPIAPRGLITQGAGAVSSSARDLSRYLDALLGGGANDRGAVLKPDSLSAMYAPQYRPDARVPGIGLAFQRRDVGGHLVIEHDGLMPGFSAEMALAPDDGVGVVALVNGARNAKMWLGTEVAGLLRHLLGVPGDTVRRDVPQRPDIWPELCGWYAFRGSPADIQRWFIAGVRVCVRNGQLMLAPVTPIPALARGLALCPDDPADPYVFRVDLSALGMGTTRLVFGHQPGQPASAVHLEAVPLSFDRRAARSDPHRWAVGVLAAAAGAAAMRSHLRARR